MSDPQIELWAEGLLPARRALHLAVCPGCLTTAERERKLFVRLARLERFAPGADFADRVIAQVRIPTASGGYER